jgi:hypothetical protein
MDRFPPQAKEYSELIIFEPERRSYSKLRGFKNVTTGTDRTLKNDTPLSDLYSYKLYLGSKLRYHKKVLHKLSRLSRMIKPDV